MVVAAWERLDVILFLLTINRSLNLDLVFGQAAMATNTFKTLAKSSGILGNEAEEDPSANNAVPDEEYDEEEEAKKVGACLALSVW